MNHKRGRPKNRRAGCLLCKPHKMNHAKDPDTLDVDIADQPEEGNFGNSSKKKSVGWPRPLKISCKTCGALLETRLCANRREIRKTQNDRFRASCAECKNKLQRRLEEEAARRQAHIL